MSESVPETSYGRHALRYGTPETAMTEMIPKVTGGTESLSVAETPPRKGPIATLKRWVGRIRYVPVASLATLGLLAGSSSDRPTTPGEFTSPHSSPSTSAPELTPSIEVIPPDPVPQDRLPHSFIDSQPPSHTFPVQEK